jgi:hypothetical protein
VRRKNNEIDFVVCERPKNVEKAKSLKID